MFFMNIGFLVNFLYDKYSKRKYMSLPVVQVENVNKNYGELKAVQSLSFSVDPAMCYGLLGPNGAGKTTMMKIIYGKGKRNEPEKSTVNVFGFDPQCQELEIKNISGVVPQEDNLDQELNVLQNLHIFSNFYGIPRKKARERIEDLLEFLELKEKKTSRIKELSGGMKRRLTIARALLNNPRLLILDEPTTGLDPQVRHVIWDKLRALKRQGVTILLTTHYMEEAFQICERILIMDKGRKIMEGHPQTLLEQNIEKYVLEIFNRDAAKDLDKLIRECSLRKDESFEVTYLHSNDLECLNRIANNLKAGEYFLRQSNLEDLFLKATGRSLNEIQ
jgi:lipooligosaccharide transport system ATP-binding protein